MQANAIRVSSAAMTNCEWLCDQECNHLSSSLDVNVDLCQDSCWCFISILTSYFRLEQRNTPWSCWRKFVAEYERSAKENGGKLEQPSILYERCERSASSTPSHVPKTLSIHAAWPFPSLQSCGGSQHWLEHAVQILLEENIVRAEDKAVSSKIDDIVSGLQTGAKSKMLQRMGWLLITKH
jgi:hypothetical protein